MGNLFGLPDELRVEADGPVRIVTLNRPDDRNPATTAMLFALTSLTEALGADEEARAVVLTGGGRAFSACGDFPAPRAHHEGAGPGAAAAAERSMIDRQQRNQPG